MKFSHILIVRLLATLILSIVSSSLAGQLSGTAILSTWNGPVAMAYPTAVCFVLTSLSLFAVTVNPYPYGQHRNFQVDIGPD